MIDQTKTYFIARRFFIRFLGIVYLIAFASMWTQIEGLIGSTGILPAKEYLAAAKEYYGFPNIFGLPTIFWFGCWDKVLVAVCGLGVVASILIISGFFPVIALSVAWVFYLSIVHVGQTFLSFQWDILLLEVGFLSIFLCPWRRMLNTFDEAPPQWVMFAFRLLLFKLMFQSGLVKILSNDANWLDLSAIHYHMFTQPLPNLVSWFAYHQPFFLQEFFCVVLFFVELIVPFSIILHRTTRLWGCGILILFQGLIMLTGNFGFFNLLTVALCFLLIDDKFFRRKIYDKTFAEWGQIPAELKLKNDFIAKIKDIICQVVVGVLISLTFLNFANMKASLPQPVEAVMKVFRPYLINNSYGLFASMTTERTEIIIEGSNDGHTWKAYEFRYKPGNTFRRPAQVAPHQPRLDWQMWFAALLPDYRYTPWFANFLKRILEGDKHVMKLMWFDPFYGNPPRFLRAKVYDYKFTTKKQRAENGEWWRRTEKGYFAPIMQLE